MSASQWGNDLVWLPQSISLSVAAGEHHSVSPPGTDDVFINDQSSVLIYTSGVTFRY